MKMLIDSCMLWMLKERTLHMELKQYYLKLFKILKMLKVINCNSESFKYLLAYLCACIPFNKYIKTYTYV